MRLNSVCGRLECERYRLMEDVCAWLDVSDRADLREGARYNDEECRID